MQGACSNQIVKCIIYTSDMDVGINKLLEIEKDKNESGIETVFKGISKSCEEWITVNPNAGARGYRWRKAWIDANNTTISQLYSNIVPCGSDYQWEDYKLFNL